MATARLPDPAMRPPHDHVDHDHGHDHDHLDHNHDHRHHDPLPEPTLPPSREGSVVLELGGDIGALVLYVDEQLDGAEIDLFEAGSTRPFVHSAVRARHLPSSTVYAAVYPEVPAGDYVVAAHGTRGASPVRIDGGRVTELGERSAGAS